MAWRRRHGLSAATPRLVFSIRAGGDGHVGVVGGRNSQSEGSFGIDPAELSHSGVIGNISRVLKARAKRLNDVDRFGAKIYLDEIDRGPFL